jgi:hypothetical protein
MRFLLRRQNALFSALPLLTYPNVRSAAVLENFAFLHSAAKSPQALSGRENPGVVGSSAAVAVGVLSYVVALFSGVVSPVEQFVTF